MWYEVGESWMGIDEKKHTLRFSLSAPVFLGISAVGIKYSAPQFLR